MFGEKPETVHEKAFALMRLIASNHWFVDGNKRTALNTTNLFYTLNGHELDYGEDLRAMLKLLAVREDIIERNVATEYLADQTELSDLKKLKSEIVAMSMRMVAPAAMPIHLFEESMIKSEDKEIGTDDDSSGSKSDNHKD